MVFQGTTMAFSDGKKKNVEPRAFLVEQAAEDELLRIYFVSNYLL